MNLHKFNILLITYPQKSSLVNFYRHAYIVTLMLSALLTIWLYSANDVTLKCYYTSVILFLLNGFITLLHSVLCGKHDIFGPKSVNKSKTTI